MENKYLADEENRFHQEHLEELLRMLMNSELDQKNELLSAVQKLKEIYLDKDGNLNGFRHQYSRISSCIFNSSMESGLQSGQDVEYLNDPAQILANNLTVIREEIKRDKDTELFIPVNKLYDHVNLELLRINYNAILNEDQDEKLNIVLAKIQHQDKTLEEKEIEVFSKVKEVEKKISSAQKENVSILAIFAAVIMAFTGGFSFIANSFSGLDAIPLEKLICLASFVGIILTNLLYALLKFIWGIIKREEDNKKIPFSVGALVVINVVFGIFAVVFFILSSMSSDLK